MVNNILMVILLGLVVQEHAQVVLPRASVSGGGVRTSILRSPAFTPRLIGPNSQTFTAAAPAPRSSPLARSLLLPPVYEFSAQRSGGSTNQQDQATAPEFLTPGSVLTVPMPEDEASLFHAMAYGLGSLGLGLNVDGFLIRERIAGFIVRNPDYLIAGKSIETWVTEWGNYKTVEKYAQDLSLGHLTGGVMERRLFVDIWRVNLDVYGMTGDREDPRSLVSDKTPNSIELQRILEYTPEQEPRGTVLIMSFGDLFGEDHYDALRPAHSAATGPRSGLRAGVEVYAKGFQDAEESSSLSTSDGSWVGVRAAAGAAFSVCWLSGYIVIRRAFGRLESSTPLVQALSSDRPLITA